MLEGVLFSSGMVKFRFKVDFPVGTGMVFRMGVSLMVCMTGYINGIKDYIIQICKENNRK